VAYVSSYRQRARTIVISQQQLLELIDILKRPAIGQHIQTGRSALPSKLMAFAGRRW